MLGPEPLQKMVHAVCTTNAANVINHTRGARYHPATTQPSYVAAHLSVDIYSELPMCAKYHVRRSHRVSHWSAVRQGG